MRSPYLSASSGDPKSYILVGIISLKIEAFGGVCERRLVEGVSVKLIQINDRGAI
jgi:hypothetical protein